MPEIRYDHAHIEPKWQKYWEKHEVFRAGKDSDKPKYYVLEMFAYPSSEGLHVGHPRNYIATDLMSRYYRMKGYDVLRPVGWDAFGLPAENYAVKVGIHPKKTTEKNIANYTRQVKMLGVGYDWSREINTSDPSYYKWTQWIFKTLYENGYAYQKEGYVNWCPSCQTVLANEQVVNGRCERCGTEVEQRLLKQWYFKLTDMAEELLRGLDDLDWPESSKESQRNWIGRSEGAKIVFEVPRVADTLEVFTTRPDTLFGVTFLAVAPEHPLVTDLTTDEQKEAVASYIQEAKKRTTLERSIAQDKTGVATGTFAVNPASGEEIPIYIADYVLTDYGSGAVMGVPAHDERDFAFAKKYDLPIKRVIESDTELPYIGHGRLIASQDFDGIPSQEAAGQIVEEVAGEAMVQYKLHDWLISRQRYWGAPIPIVYTGEGKPKAVAEEDLPVLLPDDVDFKPTGESPLVTSEQFQKGVETKYGAGARRETDTMDTFVDSSWYYLRYCDPQNDKVFADKKDLERWMPVDLYIGGTEHTNGHVLYARFITKVLHKLGYLSFDEPFLKLRHQGFILGSDGEKMSKSRGNVVNPDELVEKYGADTVRTYEMFIGPFDQALPWDTNGVTGVRRFLDKTYSLITERAKQFTAGDHASSPLAHRLIAKITRELEQFKFNTCVSGFMEFINEISKTEEVDWLGDFTVLLSPFAPHLAEELWQEVLKEEGSVVMARWPEADPNKLIADEVQIVVQEKGKLRGTVTVAMDADETTVRAAVAEDAKLREVAERNSNIVFVPNKVINFI